MSNLRGRYILVVEDEALVAMLLEDVLTDVGCKVMGPVSTVAQALALLKDNRPEAAVLDLNLAGETSEPVADALAALGVPFLVATGYGAEGRPAGHRGAPVLAKPYDPAELTLALARICGPRAV